VVLEIACNPESQFGSIKQHTGIVNIASDQREGMISALETRPNSFEEPPPPPVPTSRRRPVAEELSEAHQVRRDPDGG